jgi:hypothetical protein
VFLDQHIENLLVFAPGLDLHANELVKSSALILQDKASCLPAVILNPSAVLQSTSWFTSVFSDLFLGFSCHRRLCSTRKQDESYRRFDG